MKTTTQRKFIAAFQVSLDGYVAGPEGEQDWVRSWSAALGLIDDVDLFVLGVGMYPPYGDYWKTIHEDNATSVPFQNGPPDAAEIAYANKAAVTRHVVLSTKANEVNWPRAEIVRSIDELRTIKAEQGKNTYVVGGMKTLASLFEAGLIDELVLLVHPLVLGGGRALFGDVTNQPKLSLIGAESKNAGHAVLRYRVR